jgi:5-methylcytosine-specific restriction endonuclease McrA
MPWAPLQRCTIPGCIRRQAGPACSVHRRIRDAARNHHGISPARRGLGADYRRLVKVVIERDGGRCQLGLRGCTDVATTADHIVPRSAGGPTTLDNFRASCQRCNSARGARPLPR